MTQYPQRPAFYAQKFIRLMTKTAAAQELGPSACWMLSVIACQEDAKRYTEPAKYYYEQLMPLCGFTSRKQLRATIEKAESLGWLNYKAGTKGIPGKFFVKIPDAYQELEPSGCDEGFSSESELKAELKVHRKRNCKGNTSIPSPIPKKRMSTQFVPPKIEEIKAYCLERKSSVDPVRFYEYYEAGNWKDSNGKPVRNWKQKLITWESHPPNGNGQRAEPPKPPPPKPPAQRGRSLIDD